MDEARAFQKAKRRYNVLIRESEELKKNNRNDPELEAVIQNLLSEFPELKPHPVGVPFSLDGTTHSFSKQREQSPLLPLENDRDTNYSMEAPHSYCKSSILCGPHNSIEDSQLKKDESNSHLEKALPAPLRCSNISNYEGNFGVRSSVSVSPVCKYSTGLGSECENLKEFLTINNSRKGSINRKDVLNGSETGSTSNYLFLPFRHHTFLFVMSIIIAFRQGSQFDRQRARWIVFISLVISFFHCVWLTSIDSLMLKMPSPLLCSFLVHLYGEYRVFVVRRKHIKDNNEYRFSEGQQSLATALVYIFFNVIPSLAFVLVINVLSKVIIDSIKALLTNGTHA